MLSVNTVCGSPAEAPGRHRSVNRALSGITVMTESPTRGLIIRSPWIDHILADRKTWEIRSKATKIRGPIALIRGGSGLVVGKAELVDSLGPFTFGQLRSRQDKHSVPVDALLPFMRRYKDRAHAWVLDNVVAFKQPIPYDHPSGAVIWVTLSDQVLRPSIESCGERAMPGRSRCE